MKQNQLDFMQKLFLQQIKVLEDRLAACICALSASDQSSEVENYVILSQDETLRGFVTVNGDQITGGDLYIRLHEVNRGQVVRLQLQKSWQIDQIADSISILRLLQQKLSSIRNFDLFNVKNEFVTLLQLVKMVQGYLLHTTTDEPLKSSNLRMQTDYLVQIFNCKLPTELLIDFYLYDGKLVFNAMVVHQIQQHHTFLHHRNSDQSNQSNSQSSIHTSSGFGPLEFLRHSFQRSDSDSQSSLQQLRKSSSNPFLQRFSHHSSKQQVFSDNDKANKATKTDKIGHFRQSSAGNTRSLLSRVSAHSKSSVKSQDNLDTDNQSSKSSGTNVSSKESHNTAKSTLVNLLAPISHIVAPVKENKPMFSYNGQHYQLKDSYQVVCKCSDSVNKFEKVLDCLQQVELMIQDWMDEKFGVLQFVQNEQQMLIPHNLIPQIHLTKYNI